MKNDRAKGDLRKGGHVGPHWGSDSWLRPVSCEGKAHIKTPREEWVYHVVGAARRPGCPRKKKGEQSCLKDDIERVGYRRPGRGALDFLPSMMERLGRLSI